MIKQFTSIFETLKNKIPNIVEDRTNDLNNWLTNYGTVIREEICNIDDFVKIKKVLH